MGYGIDYRYYQGWKPTPGAHLDLPYNAPRHCWIKTPFNAAFNVAVCGKCGMCCPKSGPPRPCTGTVCVTFRDLEHDLNREGMTKKRARLLDKFMAARTFAGIRLQ